MRKALQIDVAGHRLFGTLHDQESPLKPQDQVLVKRTGVLLLSFGQQPRSWVGDLGSSIADRLNGCGYPTFRFDMPGLGDSPGNIPIHLEELWQDILQGTHERPLLALCEVLANKYALKGFIVGGFCGGAVTALYAVTSRPALILGLVLLEPEMALVQTKEPATTNSISPLTVDSFQERVDILKTRLRSLDSWRKLFSRKADFSFWLEFWYGLIDHSARKLASIGQSSKLLPRETNHRMLDSWQVARRKKIPTLVITVGSSNRSNYYRAYGLNPGVSNANGDLQWVEIPNTTHAMLTGGAKDAVGTHFVDWVGKNFP